MTIRKISRKALMDICTEPGAVNLITGDRKSGKTFTAVSMMQPLVEGKIKGLPKTIMFTNIVFMRAGATGRNMPPGVVYVESVEELFRQVLKAFQEYGINIRMVLVMDEAQTHMMADQSYNPVNQAMLQILSIIRKLNLAVFFLSPVMGNLVPRIRNFINDKKTPGNLNVLWYKDLPRIRRYIKANQLNYEAHQFTTWAPGPTGSRILFIPSTSWTTKVSKLKEGHAYDDESMATFRYRDNEAFDIKDLIDACSGMTKKAIVQALKDYFEELDAGVALTPEEQAKADQVERIRRMRDAKMKWADIAAVEGLSESAAKMRLKRAEEAVSVAAD